MKNLLGFLKDKALLLTLVFATCCVGFVSCGDDDDDAGGGPGVSAQAPFYGTWRAVHEKYCEDGEVDEGYFTAQDVVQLTLNTDFTYVYYVNVSDEWGTDKFTEEGTWTFKNNVLTFKPSGNPYDSEIVGDYKVLTWTPQMLVTHEDYGGGDYDVITWKK